MDHARAGAGEVVVKVAEADAGRHLTGSYVNSWFYSPIKGS